MDSYLTIEYRLLVCLSFIDNTRIPEILYIAEFGDSQHHIIVIALTETKHSTYKPIILNYQNFYTETFIKKVHNVCQKTVL